MKKVLAVSALSLAFASSAFASSYVTGNLQFHTDDLHGSDITSTLEAGHTFTNQLGGLTLYTEIDGIQLGELAVDRNPVTGNGGSSASAAWTIGGEQAFSINDNLWVAAGYQHLLVEGETVQYRPLVKIGYNFDNGISISNRTRAHINEESGNDTDYRFDNRIAYTVNQDVALSYNNVYVYAGDTNAAGQEKDSTMDHELRATWTRNGVQPYFEYRNQADNENNAFVFGASYGF
ncbi:oligogalacturonate-specific porin KdgM family protein [Vibrio agarivorans]|uniref:Oligogalacturonate-specific porin KdgM family protein n=1 Tax=Vibrio agarivorans TaxID=153622 RepID=A0ABT7XXN6_9VIBR|nr:oligogalacturonate-specific porin KdgM family protein [Vibrio agarivorans]MDN2480533.1 oligogalacturonate-specific porin KdgM family protein [Vibrio agarivorans]